MRRIDHSRFVVRDSRQVIKKPQMLPGMIIEFRYNSKSDPRPLCMLMYMDPKTNLAHSINLNYLSVGEITRVFNYMAREVRVQQRTREMIYSRGGQTLNVGGLEKEFTRFFMREVGADSVKDIYEEIIKPRILRRGQSFDIYRTYSYHKMRDLKVVELDLKALHVRSRERRERDL